MKARKRKALKAGNFKYLVSASKNMLYPTIAYVLIEKYCVKDFLHEGNSSCPGDPVLSVFYADEP